MAYIYRIVRPGAGIVSRHRVLDRALRSLERQRRGAREQGGWSDDYLEKWDSRDLEWKRFAEPNSNHPRDMKPGRW